jgi:hypothetical protein
MYNVNMIYDYGPEDVICKHCISKNNKIKCNVGTCRKKAMGDKFPQEKGEGLREGERGNHQCLLIQTCFQKLLLVYEP